MTDREHEAVIGDLVIQYSTARQERSRIAERLQGLGRTLEHFAAALRNVHHAHALPNVPTDYLDRADLIALLETFHALDSTIASLRQRLTDAGVSL